MCIGRLTATVRLNQSKPQSFPQTEVAFHLADKQTSSAMVRYASRESAAPAAISLSDGGTARWRHTNGKLSSSDIRGIPYNEQTLHRRRASTCAHNPWSERTARHTKPDSQIHYRVATHSSGLRLGLNLRFHSSNNGRIECDNGFRLQRWP